MTPHLILIGLGPHASYKHLPLIERAIREGLASGFSLLELESARGPVEERLRTFPIQPRTVAYLPDRRAEGLWYTADSDAALATLCAEVAEPRAMIATEPKAHFPYLKWCIAHRVGCLVDKPITLPMSPSGVLEPGRLAAELRELIDLARESPGNYSVMTPRRYHHAYELLRRYVAGWIREQRVPLTYVSVYHAEGVWNTPPEYRTREDHPYKYGYGKLMHSGYHYVDLLARWLALGGEEPEIEIAALTTGPEEQRAQTPDALYRRLAGAPGEIPAVDALPFGETDLTAAFKATGRTVTLGNLALLQTTPSLRRDWPLPEDVYNKTGRFGVEEARLNLGFLASVSLRIFKVPVQIDGRRIRFRDEMDLTVWRNGNLLARSSFDRRSRPAVESYLEAGRWRLFRSWLRGEERRSRIEQHLGSVRLLEKLLQAVRSA